MLAQLTALQSPGGSHQVQYWVEISMPLMPVQDQRTTQVKVLDDTGSTYLELFLPDCLRLGFDPRYTVPRSIMEGDTRISTVNGEKDVRLVNVAAQLLDQNRQPFGDVIPITAMISDAPVATRSRCSGQAFRSTFFAASAPWKVKVRTPKTRGNTPVQGSPQVQGSVPALQDNMRDHPNGGKLILAENKSPLFNSLQATDEPGRMMKELNDLHTLGAWRS